MKYVVIIADGMADYKVAELGNKTPMEAADKPTVDFLSKDAIVGTVLNVPEGMVPESDTANLAILSYDPKVYSKGRSPLEAVSMGLEMAPDDTAFRCNVVTVSEDEACYEDHIMIDHSADEISTGEAAELIHTIHRELGNEIRRFYPGVSYRHCLLWKDAPMAEFMRPHDIIGKRIGDYLPKGPQAEIFIELMKKSYNILKDHPVNLKRKAEGKNPANTIWLWSPGKKPALPSFNEKWGLRGAVISAVDLIKGIGICAGMRSIDVEGATGNIHTNFKGKAEAAIKALKDGFDFVFVHVEAPDECGHRAEIENKVLSIEKIDHDIVKPVYEYLKSTGDDYKIMFLPDHPTPLCLRTHTSDPVPFLIYSGKKSYSGVSCFTEATAAEKNFYIPHGYTLLDLMIKDKQ